MSKLAGFKVIEIPKFKAVSSGLDTFENIFGENGFNNWLKEKKIIRNAAPYEGCDFMCEEGDKAIWIWAVEDWVKETDVSPYELIEFEGGIYVVGVADENDNEDIGDVYNSLLKWIQDSNVFELDVRPEHGIIFHRVGCGRIEDITGIAQQEMFIPIKIKK